MLATLALDFNRHYTGIEVAEPINIRPFGLRWLALSVYVQRDAITRDVTFVRISGWRWMFGAHFGLTNYLRGSWGRGRGVEFFGSNGHCGMVSETRWALDWSGSIREPRAEFTLRFGRFGIGGRTPGWVRQVLTARAVRRADREYETLMVYYAEHFDDEPSNFNDAANDAADRARVARHVAAFRE